MNKKLLLLLSAALLPAAHMCAQKALYLPYEWKNPSISFGKDSMIYKESDPENKYTWSKSRSKESENFIVYWDKNYGKTNPSNADATYRVDIDYLLQQAESFYKINVEKLGFANSADSYVNKYKSMILLNHTTDWVCYGAGYDFTVPALWLSPNTSQPVGHSVAHEVGHSFQYMCYSDASKAGSIANVNVGFHDPIGQGAGIWEQCAQWQGLISFPEQMYDQSIGLFRNTHNYAFTHEWHRYQSYWFLYYLAQYYNDLTIVSQVWKHKMSKKAPDFNETLMNLKQLSSDELYKMYFDYACRLVTWDLDACKPYRDAFIGDFNYRCSAIGDKEYQVALASCPQSTGFNVIPLQVPAAGTKVTTKFTAPQMRAGAIKLADADPGEYFNGDKFVTYDKRTYVNNSNGLYRGFRIGYVVLLKDGTRQYINDDEIHCVKNTQKTEEISMTVPENTDKMWLVVSPAPAKYLSHLWDEKISINDDMWPYSFKLEGTDIGSKAIVYMAPTIDGRAIEDAKFTYDVYFPAQNSYAGTSVSVGGKANAMLGTAFQLQGNELTGKIVNYSATGPKDGQIMFYAENRGGSLVKQNPTANGYGYWYAANGNVSSYANGYTFAEFSPSSLTFNLGQYPGRNSNGTTRTIRQALKYQKSATESATVSFVFNIHFDAGKSGAELSGIEYDEKNATAIEAVKILTGGDEKVNVYNMMGQMVKQNIPAKEATASLSHGMYVVGNKKVFIP